MDTRGFIPPTPLKCSGDVMGNWNTFRFNFRVYMEATAMNKEPEKRKIAIFLNLIGEEALQLHRNKIIKYSEPSQGEEMSLKIVMKGYENFFKLCQDSVVFNTVQFDARKQSENESFQSFLEAIAILAETCKFDNKERAIRDKIVSGINDSNLQTKLILMEDQSLENVIDVCRSYELQKNKKKLPAGSNEETWFFLQKKIFLNQQQQQSSGYNQGISRVLSSGSKPSSEQAKRKNTTLPVENNVESARNNVTVNSKKLRHEENYEVEPGECLLQVPSRPTQAKNVADQGNVCDIQLPADNPKNNNGNNPKPSTSGLSNQRNRNNDPKPAPRVPLRNNTPENNNNNPANMHECTICGKIYVRYTNLVSHMKLHTGKGLFTCGRCKKSYLHLKGLENHMMKNHGTNL